MKKLLYLSIVLLLATIVPLKAQMGVNSTGAAPAASAMLDVSSTNKGFLMPRMTTGFRNLIPSPANGLMVYDTDFNEIFIYNLGWGRSTSRNAPLTLFAPSIPTGTNAIVGIGPNAISAAAGVRGEVQALAQGSGVYGISTNAGITGDTYGVRGHNSTLNAFGYGVYGTHAGTGVAIFGESVSGDGVAGYANKINPTFNTVGVSGRNQSNNGFGYGVQGVHVGSGVGVSAVSSNGNGIVAETGATFVSGKAALLALGGDARGVYAISTTNAIEGQGNVTGVFGRSTSGTGTFGQSNTSRGVWGRGLTTGDGVYGDAVSGNAVRGESSSSGTGGYFRSVTGEAIDASTGNNFAIRADNNSSSTATGSFFNIALGTAVKLFGGETALDITGGIKVSGSINTKTAFKITSNTGVGGNASSNELRIPNTTLANNSSDILIVTHNFSPNNTFFDKAFGVYWTSSNWAIFLEDQTAMPNNITFNVLVIKQ